MSTLPPIYKTSNSATVCAKTARVIAAPKTECGQDPEDTASSGDEKYVSTGKVGDDGGGVPAAGDIGVVVFELGGGGGLGGGGESGGGRGGGGGLGLSRINI